MGNNMFTTHQKETEMIKPDDDIYKDATGVTKQEWDAYSRQVNNSVEKLKTDSQNTLNKTINNDVSYHPPKIGGR